ncbi:MAG: penicillin-binding protein [Candidatus Omnitrophica bacterium]|nr:penicillin-binding protein [Candidatus Omnitrophota bacterium]
MAKISKTRLFFVFSFFILALVCLLFRLGFIQIFQSSKYLSISENQSRDTIVMPPARGRILDRKGRELALDIRLDSLYAVSRDIKNKGPVADALSRILGLNREMIYERLSRDKKFVWIARKISPAQSAAIQRLKIKELVFVKESLRVYPKAETACHLIGFTDIDNEGIEGVELNYNSFLKGVSGWRLAQKDAKRRELISKEIEMVAPLDGHNVHLTIDEVIQSIAEKELSVICKKHNALGGSVVVMDPKSGDVLAMATYPLYDLNHAKRTRVEFRRNRAITDLFEPGSVFKTFTLSSILENKVFGLDQKFDCEHGSWAVAGKVLHDHRGHGVMSFREIIEKSSNIGTVKGAMRLGADRLYKTIRLFGFGERTGIGLAGEVNGLVPHPRVWSRSSIINIPIGQGIAVTPIQLATAVSAIANDGLEMRPRVITHIDDFEGRVVKSFNPEPIRRVISREAALQARSVLEGVVSRGTGKKAVVPGFKAAGKTGTAQKILPNGTYSHDHFVASFIGFVPYDEPKVSIVVSVDQPHPVYYGGEVAAPVFSRVAAGILAYWQISQNVIPPEVVSGSAKKSGTAAKKRAYKQPLPSAVGAASQVGLAGQ